MKLPRKTALALCAVLVLCICAWTLYQSSARGPDGSMAQLMPKGAMLFLEGKDFGGLLKEWNASPEKQQWLKSDNYEVFSRSRLFLRLEQVQQEFATAAGIPPNMSFLSEVAGEHSALAIYDIGKLELLYITRLPSARITQSALWQKRAQFEPRQAAGQQFFVRTDPESGRVVAFAMAGDELLLATREDLMAGALSVLAGQQIASLAEEDWFYKAVKAGKEPGDLRMVINLAAVTHTPHFRTYWVQQNITELRGYEASLTDLYCEGPDFREERILLRPESAPTDRADAEEADRAAAVLLQSVPPGAGVYRVSSLPDPETVSTGLQQRVLTPRLGTAPRQKLAPVVVLTGGAVGSETDLEKRIDVPPVAMPGGSDRASQLKLLLEKSHLRAVMEVGRTEAASDGVFINLRSTIVLCAATDWDAGSIQTALQKVLAPGLTISEMGASWKQAGDAAAPFFKLDGLVDVAMATKGRYLVVSNDEPILQAVLKSLGTPGTLQPLHYAAGFNHAGERQNFYKFASILDVPSRSANVGEGEPEFFSQNIASLSRTLAGVGSETIVVRRAAGLDRQTVRYRWAH